MGRRKIDIRPILDERNRTVTLNKRKAGLFKKAHELAVLCQVDLALVVITPDGKLYEYSTTPNAGDIFQRRQSLSVVEEKHPGDFGFCRGTMVPNSDGLDDYEDSEGDQTDDDENQPVRNAPSAPRRQGHVRNVSAPLDRPSSRPRLKVQIPGSSSEPKSAQPGPLTALAANSAHISTALRQTVASAAAAQAAHAGKQPQSKQLQSAVPVAASQPSQHARQPSNSDTDDKDKQAQLLNVPRIAGYAVPPAVQQQYHQAYLVAQQQQQQQQQQQESGGCMPPSPGGLLPPYFGYRGFFNQGGVQGAAGAPVQSGLPVGYSLGGYPGGQPVGYAQRDGGTGVSSANSSQWSAYPQSPMNYFVPPSADASKQEPGPLTAAVQSRYANETTMSPSAMFSMEWNGGWDPRVFPNGAAVAPQPTTGTEKIATAIPPQLAPLPQPPAVHQRQPEQQDQ